MRFYTTGDFSCTSKIFGRQKMCLPVQRHTKLTPCAFEKLYNVKLHSMVTSTLNSFKKGAKTAVERRKQTELTIGKMKEKKQYISPEDFKVVTSLLWKRILGWISRHRSRAQDDPTISPDASLESTELQPAQLAVMAMDFMVFFYFTIGGFGARAQFLEVSCSCDLCSGFCRVAAVQKKKTTTIIQLLLYRCRCRTLRTWDSGVTASTAKCWSFSNCLIAQVQHFAPLGERQIHKKRYEQNIAHVSTQGQQISRPFALSSFGAALKCIGKGSPSWDLLT